MFGVFGWSGMFGVFGLAYSGVDMVPNGTVLHLASWGLCGECFFSISSIWHTETWGGCKCGLLVWPSIAPPV